MHTENKNIPKAERKDWQWTPRARKIGVYVAGLALSAPAAMGMYNAAKGPEMHGDQTVQIEPGSTVDGMIKTNVDGGASHTGEVREEVFKDPQNTSIFENGKTLGSEDIGKNLHMPQDVDG